MPDYKQLSLFDEYIDEQNEDNFVEEYRNYALYQEATDEENLFEYKVFDQYGVMVAKWKSKADSLSMPTNDYKSSSTRQIFMKVISQELDKKRKEAAAKTAEQRKAAREVTSNAAAKSVKYASWYDDDDDDIVTRYRNDLYGGDGTRYSYSGSYSGYSGYTYTPKPKSKGFLDKLNKSNTLVVHCEDSSTDMLSQVYDGKGWDVLRDGNIDPDELHQLLTSHERLVFLGHGTGSGLINKQGGGCVIGAAEAPYLKDKKIFAIWCNADKYFTAHGIGKGCFITKNVPSEVWEAAAVGYHVSAKYILENITYWSKCCADVAEQALEGDAAGAVKKAREMYQAKYGPEGELGSTSSKDELGVTEYNTDAIRVQ